MRRPVIQRHQLLYLLVVLLPFTLLCVLAFRFFRDESLREVRALEGSRQFTYLHFTAPGQSASSRRAFAFDALEARLDMATGELEDRFHPRRPDRRAQSAGTLTPAEAFMLGDFPVAQALVEHELRAARVTHVEKGKLRRLHDLAGAAARENGDLAGCLQHQTQALMLALAPSPPGQWEKDAAEARVWGYHGAAVAFLLQDRPAEAEGLLRAALLLAGETGESHAERDAVALARTYAEFTLAQALSTQGRHAEGVEILGRIQTDGDQPAFAIACRDQVIAAYEAAGDFEAAANVARVQYHALANMHWKSRDGLLDRLNQMGTYLLLAGKPAEAEAEFRRAASRGIARGNETGRRVARESASCLIALLRMEGQMAEAAAWDRVLALPPREVPEGLRRREREARMTLDAASQGSGGLGSPMAVNAALALARHLMTAGRWEEAEAELRGAVRVVSPLESQDEVELAARQLLAEALTRQGFLEGAAEEYGALLPRLERGELADYEVRGKLAALWLRLGRREESGALYQEVLGEMEADVLFGPEHWLTLEARVGYVKWLMEGGEERAEEAEMLARGILRSRERRLGSGDALTEEARDLLVRVMARRGG